jgi:hypothetical protein
MKRLAFLLSCLASMVVGSGHHVTAMPRRPSRGNPTGKRRSRRFGETAARSREVPSRIMRDKTRQDIAPASFLCRGQNGNFSIYC